jgi:CDP-glucose 4,6-dehydratase
MEEQSGVLEGLAMNNHVEKAYHNRTVLITGATGFKGSWLAIWLLKLNAKVLGYSLEPRTPADNYTICGLSKHIRHINGNILDLEKLRGVFSQYKPEIVFHLAAQSLVKESYHNPVDTFQTNVMGTVNLIEAARLSPFVKAIIIVTSDKCYENKEWVYGYRETDPLGGKDPYSASKAAAEIVTNSFFHSFLHNHHSAALASVRAGNVIGGGDWSPYRIIPDCVRALRNGLPVEVRYPDAVRPWQHVIEPLYGYLLLGMQLLTNGEKFCGAWNFGPDDTNEITVKVLVAELIRQWGSGAIRLETANIQTPETGILRLDHSKASQILNWTPIWNYRQAVRYTIAEYRQEGADSSEILRQRLAHIDEYLYSQKKRR